MTVYVDDLFEWPSNDWRKGRWCHMWTDGDEDGLHEVARAMGLKRSWFQTSNPRFHHYDLRPSMREKALQWGAVYMPLKQWITQRLQRGNRRVVVMQGTRRDIDGREWTTAQAWDYGKLTHDLGWYWYCCVPGDNDNGFMMGDLSKHTVTEHEDGTITVSPSILIGIGVNSWHGYLERGVWREV